MLITRRLSLAPLSSMALLLALAQSHADAATGSATWASTLQPRDVNGDGVVDAYFDTALQITWLADARAAAGSVFEMPDLPPGSGAMTWSNANAWVSGLDVHGVGGWRLPSVLDTGAPGCQWTYGGTDCGYNVQTISADGTVVYSEMAHLDHVSLGNLGFYDAAGARTDETSGNTGPILRLTTNPHWLSVVGGSPAAATAWIYVPMVGLQAQWLDLGPNQGGDLPWAFALAVHDGDVATAVPEPSTYGLMALGLLGLAGRTNLRRRRHDLVK